MVVTVAAVTGEPVDGRRQISAIMVPAGTPGLHVTKRYSKVGWSASDTNELSFSDCRVPADYLLGEEGVVTRSSSRSWTRDGWR